MPAIALLTLATELAIRNAVGTIPPPRSAEAAEPMSELTQPHWEIVSVGMSAPDTASVKLSSVQFGSLILKQESRYTVSMKLTEGEWKVVSTSRDPEYRLPAGSDTSQPNPV